MSASLTMRLVPARTVPKALSVIFGAVSIALVIAAPLGSFLGGIIGWRNVFNAAAVMGVLCIIWVWKALPSLPGEAAHHKQNMFALLKRPGVLAGMTAIFMAFAGQFAFFTYIRPVFMTMAGFDVDGLTLVLLSFGIASFVGTSLSSQFLKRSLKVALAGAPLVLAASATVLVLWGSDKWVASAIAIIWGFAFALVPVGWSTWITRSLADQAEKAGSIQVAVIQLANTCGAAIGGVALDHLGLTSPLVISGTLMLLTALLVAGKVKRSSVFLPLPWERVGVRASGYADALTLLRESIEISTTDDTISSVPSQSGRVNATPSKTTDSSALLSGSAQLRMLAFGPPIICAPFRYRLNVSAVPITTR
jgi:DHA1 family purine ribonucleoside efflux pump-like MFS transporter